MAISEPGWTSRNKAPLGIRLKSTSQRDGAKSAASYIKSFVKTAISPRFVGCLWRSTPLPGRSSGLCRDPKRWRSKLRTTWAPWRDFSCFHAGRPAWEAWLIPVGGGFFFRGKQNSDKNAAFLAFLRVLRSGLHRVAYAPLLQWFVNAADMSNTIKGKMDDTCHMKYTDHFY